MKNQTVECKQEIEVADTLYFYCCPHYEFSTHTLKATYQARFTKDNLSGLTFPQPCVMLSDVDYK